jgi:serine/threonine protein kinase
MGTVYEAHDERFENSVALKEVLIDLAKIADPVQQQMVARAFEREAKTLALLHHEAFPHVIDYFSERDHQYLIMELIRGEDLGEQLQSRKKPFEFEDVLEWTKQLLDALDYLHTREQPIIHRDLKPQNMKITARGKVKVLDFGIAKGADNKSSSTITNQTFVAATLNYSPIEQLLRVLDPTFREFISQRHKEKVDDILEHTADARSDLYSLGATLYQLLTATQPHDTLKRALDIWAGKPDPLPNPMELNPKIPPYFNNILLKSMEIDRDSRFVSAADMQQALKSYLENESRTESEFKQAAWIAEQQRMQTPPPDIGMQTQIRIAEEMKFLDELASPETSKTENMPAANQQPFVAPPTAPPFSLPTNESDERRRIAEQQKFLADLDAPNSPPVNQAPVQQSDALTNYGQAAMPSGQQADQTNYAPQQNNSQNYDQTQVSYLADVLPPAQA